MTVRENQIFHLDGVKAEFLVTADDDSLRFFGIVQAIDLNDAVAGDQRPRSDDVGPQVVELIEDLRGRRSDWRRGGRSGYRRHGAVREIAPRQVACREKIGGVHVIHERHRILRSACGLSCAPARGAKVLIAQRARDDGASAACCERGFGHTFSLLMSAQTILRPNLACQAAVGLRCMSRRRHDGGILTEDRWKPTSQHRADAREGMPGMTALRGQYTATSGQALTGAAAAL